jgi:hypothetical protein
MESQQVSIFNIWIIVIYGHCHIPAGGGQKDEEQAA